MSKTNDDDDKVMFFYDADKNPRNAFYADVPLANVTRGAYNALPVYLQESIANSGFYRAAPGVRKELDDQAAARAAAQVNEGVTSG